MRRSSKLSSASMRLAGITSALVIGLLLPAPGTSAAPLAPHGGPDPGTIFVANSANNSITEYAPGANGNATPSATIVGAATKLSQPEGIALNPTTGEILVANAASNSITEYTTDVSGNAAPDITISGSNTLLAFPDAIVADAAGDIFVANSLANSITEYSPGTSGNMAPINTIMGSHTLIDRPHGVTLDAAGDLFVASADNVITEYGPGASGDATPTATISGSSTGLNGPFGPALDAKGNMFVANAGAPSVTEYAKGANGNASPATTIAGANTGLTTPEGVAFDTVGNLYVANESGKSITEYSPGAHGNAIPVATISGANTGLDAPRGITIRPGLVPAKLVFVTQPSGGTAGNPLATQPAVAVEDAEGNLVTTDNSTVTLSITPGTGTAGASLTCTSNSVATSSGVATFSGCAIDNIGTGYTLHATDNRGLTPAESAPLNVTGAAAKLVFVTQPSNGTSGNALPVQPKVAVEDAAGNVVTTDTSQVSLSIKAGTGTAGAALSCVTNLLTASSGVAAFAGCAINLAGTGYVLHATDASLTPADSSGISIVAPALPPIGHLTWSSNPIAPPGSLRPGQMVQLAVMAFDAHNRPIAGALVYVSLHKAARDTATATCGSASLPSYCTADQNGRVHVSYKASSIDRGGADTLEAAVDPFGTLKTTDQYVYQAVNGSHPTQLIWSPNPIAPAHSLAAGQGATARLTVMDRAGAVVANAQVGVKLSPAPGSGASISGPACTAVTGHPHTLTCHTNSSGQITIHYISAATPPTGGSDALEASTRYTPTPARDVYTYLEIDHLTWSPDPIAQAGTVGPRKTVHVTATAFDAHGQPIPQIKVYISLKLPRLDRATAMCAGHTLPSYCLTNSAGQVDVAYTTSGGLVQGSDTLLAAADPFGTDQAADLYTYAAPVGARITNLIWSPTPIAPVATLAPGSHVTATVTAVDAHGNPVPQAKVDISLTRAPGSNATISGHGCSPVTGRPQSLTCVTDSAGQNAVRYTASSLPLPTGGSDAIEAKILHASTRPSADIYSYVPIGHLSWSPDPIGQAGSLGPGTSVGVTATAFDVHGHAIPGALVYVSILPASVHANATISCNGVVSLPGYCTADQFGQVHVIYKTAKPGVDGADTLVAAADPFGTDQVTNSYTYLAPRTAHVAKLIWTPSPVAPAQTLPPGQHANVTLTAVDAKGSPVANAQVYLSLSPAPGSDATISGRRCTSTLPRGTLLCHTDSLGQIMISYKASSPFPAGGSDGIDARTSLTAKPVTDVYSYG